jgi:hypothetical protein
MKHKTVAILVTVMAGLLLYPSGTSWSQSIGAVADGVVTPLLQYQGRLTDPATGKIVADGSYSMDFRLYDVEAGGTALWLESKAVTVQGGLFSTVLGDTTALDPYLFNGQALWLGVTVEGEQLGPRQPVLPVAYALSLVPGAVVASNSGPALQVSHLGGGEALLVGGSLNVSGSLIGGSHTHSGGDITSGTVADGRISSTIARDSEIMPSVLANDGPGSTLDADLLDGNQASAFALSAHNHDNRYYTESETKSLYVDATGDMMTGELIVPKISYSSPRTNYFMVGGEGFLPWRNVDYSNSEYMGGAYLYSGSGAMAAPVHLPQGAVVISFRVFFYDSSTSDLSVDLSYIPATGGYYDLASVDSAGISGYASRTDTSISYATIDNTLYSYHIRAWSNSWDGNNLRVMGALITYTTSEVP